MICTVNLMSHNFCWDLLEGARTGPRPLLHTSGILVAGPSWDAMLKTTDVEFALLTDYDMHLIVCSGYLRRLDSVHICSYKLYWQYDCIYLYQESNVCVHAHRYLVHVLLVVVVLIAPLVRVYTGVHGYCCSIRLYMQYSCTAVLQCCVYTTV